MPAAPASPLNRYQTIIKKEKAAMVWKVLKIKNVATHSFLNGLFLRAASELT